MSVNNSKCKYFLWWEVKITCVYYSRCRYIPEYIPFHSDHFSYYMESCSNSDQRSDRYSNNHRYRYYTLKKQKYVYVLDRIITDGVAFGTKAKKVHSRLKIQNAIEIRKTRIRIQIRESIYKLTNQILGLKISSY